MHVVVYIPNPHYEFCGVVLFHEATRRLITTHLKM